MGDKGVFTMDPSEGSVPAAGYKECTLTYNPTPVAGEPKAPT